MRDEQPVWLVIKISMSLNTCSQNVDFNVRNTSSPKPLSASRRYDLVMELKSFPTMCLRRSTETIGCC